MSTRGGHHPRVLCLGFDAMDPGLIAQWAQARALPTFASLYERAALATTRNPEGLFVGAIWPSFFTGVSPARHGRYCFKQVVPGTYREDRFLPEHLKWPPFWSRLSQAGRRVAIVDVPKSPLCADLSGVQLKDWYTHDPEYGADFETWPTPLAEDVVARFGADPVGDCDAIARSAEGYARFRDGLLQRIERKTALCGELLAQESWDLFLAVFADSHCAGHQAWTIHDDSHPDHSAELARLVGDPLRDVYVALDRALASILRWAGPETTVIVLASHGMGPHFDGTFMLDEILLRLEPTPSAWERIAAAPARRRMERIEDRVRRRLAPATLKQVSRDRLLQWRRAYAVHNNDVYGGIRVNLGGREPRGRIRPGRDLDAYFAELRRDLREIRNLDTGEPVVRDLLRTSDLYPGERLDHLPDFLVEWNRVDPITRVASAKIGTLEKRFPGVRNGDHTPGGACWMLGPEIAPGERLVDISVMDLAPTMAALLDVSLDEVDGRPIETVLPRRRAAVAGGST